MLANLEDVLGKMGLRLGKYLAEDALGREVPVLSQIVGA